MGDDDHLYKQNGLKWGLDFDKGNLEGVETLHQNELNWAIVMEPDKIQNHQWWGFFIFCLGDKIFLWLVKKGVYKSSLFIMICQAKTPDKS